MSLSRSELARKLVHISVGFLAFLLRDLGPLWGAVLAMTAVLFNIAVLPRIGGRRLLRGEELDRGHSLGIVLYPVCVLLLILFFWRRLEVAAAVWGILAMGDGMAAIAGQAWGRARLPWNPRKSWVGSGAYVLFGTAAATTLLLWTAPGRYGVAFAVLVAAVCAVVAAFLESLPQGLDDNLGVPLLTALLMLGLLWTQGHWGLVATPEFSHRLLAGAAVNLVLAVAALAIRGVNRSGAVAGFLLGTAIFAFLGWRGYLLLFGFFVLGTAFTQLGYRKKAAQRLAQEEGGRRGARHALANAGVATVCAVLAATTEMPVFFAVAFAAAFATAAADTAGSELGQLWGRRTFLVTTLKPVPKGTEGAVSLEGTLAGVVSAALLAAVGAAVGLYPWVLAVAVTAAAVLGSLLESFAGALLDRRALLDNEAMNFLNTLVGALLGGLFTRLAG